MYVFIAVEVFYIFFVASEMAAFLLVVVLANFEVLVISAGFTTVGANCATNKLTTTCCLVPNLRNPCCLFVLATLISSRISPQGSS